MSVAIPIGPTIFVPSPTFVTRMYSSSIFTRSSLLIDDIPLNLNIVEAALIFPTSWYTKSVWAIGCCPRPSSGIYAFERPFAISNWWLLPSPASTSVTASPPLVIDIENLSSFSLIANTRDGKKAVLPAPIL